MRRADVKQIDREEELFVLKSRDFDRLIAYLRSRQILRRCAFCGREFLAARKDVRYCSSSCRSRTSRMRARVKSLLEQS